MYVSFAPKGPKIQQVTHFYKVRIQPVFGEDPVNQHKIPSLEALVRFPRTQNEKLLRQEWRVQVATAQESSISCHPMETVQLQTPAEPCLSETQLRCPLVFKEELQLQVTGILELVGEIKESTMLSLCSSVFVSFNSTKHFHLYGSNASLAQVIMKVDIIYEKNMLHLYLISSFGGLLVLLLIFWVLYKIGFFKRKLKEKMEADGDTPDGLPGANSEPLASEKEALEPLQGEKAEEKDKA